MSTADPTDDKADARLAAHPAAARPVTGIVGLGTVGEALLLLLHKAGHDLVAVDHDPDALARAARRIAAAAGGPPPADVISFSAEPAALSRAALVVEATPEDRDAKVDVLRRIGGVCPAGTPVATTATALSVADLAIASGRPGQTLGLLFHTPPVLGGTVTIVPTAMSASTAVEAVRDLVCAAGLEPVAVGLPALRDARALVLGYLNRCAALLDTGFATATEIDTALRLGCGLPYGPFEFLDRMGLDTAFAELAALRRASGDDRYEPASLLGRMAAAGTLGRKTGQGFHRYDDTGQLRGDTGQVPAAGQVKPVTRVGVVGSGTMAGGIAETSAVAGYQTVLVARNGQKAARAVAGIGDSLTRGGRRGRIAAADRGAALARLQGADSAASLADCDLVIEAVVEDLEAKRAVFAELGDRCKPGTVLATTTSSLSVAACAEACAREADVLGMHFFNPAPMMRLVEMACTDQTSENALATARAFCASLGKTVVVCRDEAGFIVNRLLFPYLAAAVTLLGRRPDADIEETDAAVERAFGYPMGPFTLLDTIGLDVSLAIQQQLFDRFRDPAYEPAAPLRQLVAAGFLRRQTGLGFRAHRRPGTP